MVLEFVCYHFRLTGILYPSNDASKFAKRFFNVHSGFILTTLAIFTVPTLCYCLFEAVTFSELVNSFFLTLCGMLGVLFQSVLLHGKSSINQLIVDIIEQFYERSVKCPQLKAIYNEAGSTIESQTRIIYMLMLRASVPIIVVQFIAWSFFQYFRSDFSNDSFVLIYPWAIPFDWKSPHGYVIVTLIQAISIVNCSEVCIVVLCFFTGICLAIAAFISDIEYCLNDFNVEAAAAFNKSSEQAKITQKFKDIIQFHAETRELTMTFARRIRGIIIFFFAYATVSISSLLLCITASKVQDAIQSAACLNIAMFWLFMYCYFGDQVTSRHINITDGLYFCNWHLFPIQVQKSLQMAIHATENPLYIYGFGTTSCTRFTFKTITNAGFTYFTMLRQVTN